MWFVLAYCRPSGDVKMPNPFECGTSAHNAWESRTGESNCNFMREKKTKGGAVEAPHWKSFEDFKKACGL